MCATSCARTSAASRHRTSRSSDRVRPRARRPAGCFWTALLVAARTKVLAGIVSDFRYSHRGQSSLEADLVGSGVDLSAHLQTHALRRAVINSPSVAARTA